MKRKRQDSRAAGKSKASPKKDRAWFERKVVELKTELDKLPADRQEQLAKDLKTEEEH